VFLLDVDNTLLDSDKFVADFRAHLEIELGFDGAKQYWAGYAELHARLGYVDYLGALQVFGAKGTQARSDDPKLLKIASFLLDYPFSLLVYPLVFHVIRYLSKFGTTVILSDGDVVLQPRKIQRSGLWEAVDGRVLIYVHKELMVKAIEYRYPAKHYVLVDDKPRLLAAMKLILKDKLTTIMPRQGHYALDKKSVAAYPIADLVIEQIGDLVDIDIQQLIGQHV
jgi:FMN phosphatase YigB (HAD superfamily)